MGLVADAAAGLHAQAGAAREGFDERGLAVVWVLGAVEVDHV